MFGSELGSTKCWFPTKAWYDNIDNIHKSLPRILNEISVTRLKASIPNKIITSSFHFSRTKYFRNIFRRQKLLICSIPNKYPKTTETETQRLHKNALHTNGFARNASQRPTKPHSHELILFAHCILRVYKFWLTSNPVEFLTFCSSSSMLSYDFCHVPRTSL